jgi:hypothetical protein
MKLKPLSFCETSMAALDELAARQGCSHSAAIRNLLLHMAPALGVAAADCLDIRISQLAALAPKDQRQRVESHIRSFATGGWAISQRIEKSLRSWGATDEMLAGLVGAPAGTHLATGTQPNGAPGK